MAHTPNPTTTPNWNWTPRRSVIRRSSPRTLVSTFEDGSISVREKSARSKRTFEETYFETKDNTRQMMEFARRRRHLHPFTKNTWDPEDFDPDTAICLVRLIKMPDTIREAGTGAVQSTWVFEEWIST